MEKCRNHDLRAQEMLYKHFYGFAKAICLRYAHNKEDAVEILNDSFMKVFDKIKSYEEQNSFKAWLKRIIVNTAIDAYRREAKHSRHLEIERAESQETDLDSVQHLQAEELLQLLEALPSVHRITFNLYEIEGYSHREIAEMLDTTESNSRSTLTRAKKKLRELYLAHYSEAIDIQERGTSEMKRHDKSIYAL
ncbi:MAG: sigma-70 family RNA polymerase sigma factor [Cytophagales bacterium]|nr:sigma-70 family RNA polymerase sigma factor [Cytophagales bacterium]